MMMSLHKTRRRPKRLINVSSILLGNSLNAR
jgi:hypothetical protein